MASRRLIDQHKDKDKIIKAIISGKNYSKISEQYGISKASISEYLSDRLIKAAAVAKVKEIQKSGELVNSDIQSVMLNIKKLYDACNEWLTDPENKERYTVEPRASEINIIYTKYIKDRPVTARGNLQDVIKQFFKKGEQVQLVYTKMADIRKIIVDTAAVLTKQLELMAKIKGAIPDVKIDITISEDWLVIKQSIIDATKAHPEVREKILNGIRKSNIER